MTEEKRETVGKITADILSKPNLDTKQSLMDTANEMNKTFLDEVQECIKLHPELTEPYYITALFRRERLIVNTIRRMFFPQQALPTPQYDQTVFKYFPASGNLKFLWVVPDKNTIDYMILHENQVPNEQRQLVEFCKLFKQKKLDTVYGE